MSVQLNSESVPDRQLQPVAATTETATETAQSETGGLPSTGAAPLSDPECPEAKLEAARAECERLSRTKFEADNAANKRLRQVQLDYGKRITQLEEDLVAERQTNEGLSKKIESLEISLDEQTKGMRRIKQQLSEPAAMLEKTMTEIQVLEQKYSALESETAALRQEREQLQSELASSQTAQQQALAQIAELTAKLVQTSRDSADLDKERTASKLSQQKVEELNLQVEKLRNAAKQAELHAHESAAQSKDWEKKAADLTKAIEDLNRTRVDEHRASTQSAQRLKELELQLKSANDNLAASRAETEKQNSARQRLESENQSLTEANAKAKADLDQERDTNKTARQEAEELKAQLRTLQHAAEQADARARESAVRCGDWEKKAADREKTIGELTRMQTAEQSAGAPSAQRIKELEQQLKLANDALAAGKADLDKQNSARQRLEGENRSLTEAHAKARGDVEKERTAGKLWQQKAEELNLQVEKFRNAAEQAELRIRESAAQSKDWEKKAADLKQVVDELNQIRVNEQSAGAQSAQRVKELEQQLKGANDNLAASKADLEKQNSARHRLELESRNLTEANAKAKGDADKERDANNALRQEMERLTAQLKKLQHGAEESELRARESAAQSLQRLKELELQLKGANDNLAASQAETEKQDSARQRLETENRKLAEANAKTRADLDKEHDAHKLSRQAAQELDAELKKAQRAAEQAEARFQKGAALGSEWQEKAAELKKANSQLDAELVRLRGIEKNAQHEEYLMVDSLRRGLRQQIEELRQSANGLLEIQLPDKQKRLAETILRHALFLQVFLNSSGKNAGEKFPS